MYKINILKLICVVIFSCCVNGKTPDYIQKCTAGNAECILKNINNIFATKYQGDELNGLDELDPLYAGTLTHKDAPGRPLQIDVVFNNVVITGLKNAKALKVKGFGKNPEDRHIFLIETPVLNFLSDYKIQGQVLILPINGEGKSNLTFINPKLKITVNGASETKDDGQVYMKVKNTKLEIQLERFVMRLDNLFNNDKVLGENMNTFLNDNWREIFDEVKPSFEINVNKPFFRTIEKFFATIPYADLVDI